MSKLRIHSYDEDGKETKHVINSHYRIKIVFPDKPYVLITSVEGLYKDLKYAIENQPNYGKLTAYAPLEEKSSEIGNQSQS